MIPRLTAPTTPDAANSCVARRQQTPAVPHNRLARPRSKHKARVLSQCGLRPARLLHSIDLRPVGGNTRTEHSAGVGTPGHNEGPL
eukprot:5057646-Prymnesium_polylepis.2